MTTPTADELAQALAALLEQFEAMGLDCSHHYTDAVRGARELLAAHRKASC